MSFLGGGKSCMFVLDLAFAAVPRLTNDGPIITADSSSLSSR